MAKEFETGERVSWGRGQSGAVLRKAVCRLDLNGRTYLASRKAPCFVIRCEDGSLTAIDQQFLKPAH